MDYQYMQPQQIRNLDYWSLVQMLLTQISPETRSIILERLVELNNQLLIGSQSTIQPDLARAAVLSSRKKDMSEIQHPSMDRFNYKGQNPLPLNIPINANNHFKPGNSTNIFQSNMFAQSSNYVAPPSPASQNSYDDEDEIDLDNIIDELKDDGNDLDSKLARIKNLHHKIIMDKRQRRKDREARK